MTAGSTIATGRTVAEGRSRGELLAAVALALVALSPVIVLCFQRWGHPYLPTQDQAVFDLRIRDVWSFSGNTPLDGPYSRFGWDHPGPTVFYLLAIFSGIFREAPWASLVGGALLQGVAVVWIARLSWKAGGLKWTALWLAIELLAYSATGPWIFQELWNPHIAFAFFALFLLQAVLVATGDARRLAGFAFVASFLVQTHIGYALLVAIIGAWAIFRFRSARRAAEERALSWRIWKWPVAVLAVVWFVPVVLDPIFHPPGNLDLLIRFYLGLEPGTHQALLGLHRGAGYLAAEFRLLPPWLGGHDPLNSLTGLAAPRSVFWLLVPVLLIAAAVLAARRSGDRRLSTIAELAGVEFAAALATLVLLRGDPQPYLFYWRIVVGASTIVLTLFVLFEAARILGRRDAEAPASAREGRLGDAARRAPAAFTLLAVAALVVAATNVSSSVAAATGPISSMSKVAGPFLARLQAEGEPRGPVVLRFYGSALGGLQGALADALVRDGKPVYFDPYYGHQFGFDRTATPSQVRSVWYATEESQLYSLMSQLPGAKVLAVSHPLPPARQRQLVSLQRRIATALEADGKPDLVADLGSPYAWLSIPSTLPGVSGRSLGTLSRLNHALAGTCLCAVIAFPSGRVPARLPAASG